MGKSPKLRIKKLSENARTPTRGSCRSAGFDLYSSMDCEIPPFGKAKVTTDLQISVPSGTYGRIAPRSGLAINFHIDIGAGVLDEDFRGNVGMCLII